MQMRGGGGSGGKGGGKEGIACSGRRVGIRVAKNRPVKVVGREEGTAQGLG